MCAGIILIGILVTFHGTTTRQGNALSCQIFLYGFKIINLYVWKVQLSFLPVDPLIPTLISLWRKQRVCSRLAISVFCLGSILPPKSSTSDSHFGLFGLHPSRSQNVCKPLNVILQVICVVLICRLYTFFGKEKKKKLRLLAKNCGKPFFNTNKEWK